ncbi:diguanylate cyclase domain-containing protein [Rhodoferax sp.]|uniref:diguanylate cyclase domain-containing protein n=1 Tax=Rhodoferax sp. TaxID=50421 RepID=UPI0027636C74|nr:GGDEF domain-containing protein [Rhodoferax sp.]
MKFGIGFKLSLLLASFGLLAMGIVGYYAYASSRATLLHATQRDLLTATQVLGQNYHASVDEVGSDALLLASVPVTRAALGSDQRAGSRQDLNALAETFEAMLRIHPEYFQIRLISTDQHGLELVRVDRDGRGLTRVQGLDLQEKAHYPYVFKTMRLKRGQIYLSDISINHELGAHAGLLKPTLRVAAPVFTDQDRARAVVVINIDLYRMFARLKADLPASYQVYLANQWGDYLVHPDATQTFGFDQGRRVLVQEAFEPVSTLITGTSTHVVAGVQSSAWSPGGEVAAFLRLPMGGVGEGRFVVLGLSQPQAEVVRETTRVAWNTVQVILVLGCIAVLLAALVSRAVTGPLRAMAHAVTLFSREQVVSRLPDKRADELGQLARSLNDMQATIVANMEEINESRRTLRHLAQHDALTGLPNRTLCDDRVQQALSQAKRDLNRMALIFVDLDDFKSINDTYGHHAGDLLLCSAARRMEGCVRNADTVGRLGGDEFLVLLATIDREQDASLVAGKIRDALSQPFDLDGSRLSITCSIGVAIYPEHGADAITLSKSADAAMYLAKEGGGNRVQPVWFGAATSG